MTAGKELARVGQYGQTSLSEKMQYAQALAGAGELVPRTFWTKPTPDGNGGMIAPRPNPGAVLYMLETAAMLGVNPMVGLTNIHIIEGKPSLSANLQAALVREAGHRLRVYVEGSGMAAKAICEIVRADDPEFTFRTEWGAEESKAAGVDNKDNWKKYRRSMLKARAITECIREACPEVLMGATYSPDELGANTDEQGEPVDLQQVPDASQTGMPGTGQKPPAEPKPQAPIPTEAPAPSEDAPDWGKLIANAASLQEVQDLYRRARADGLLGAEIKVGRKKRILGDVLTEVGTAMREAEAAAAAADEAADAAHAEDDSPAVLADDVVEGEIVDE